MPHPASRQGLKRRRRARIACSGGQSRYHAVRPAIAASSRPRANAAMLNGARKTAAISTFVSMKLVSWVSRPTGMTTAREEEDAPG